MIEIKVSNFCMYKCHVKVRLTKITDKQPTDDYYKLPNGKTKILVEYAMEAHSTANVKGSCYTMQRWIFPWDTCFLVTPINIIWYGNPNGI